jgi:acetyltransferase-like isoleucine patch superfamily enzyme
MTSLQPLAAAYGKWNRDVQAPIPVRIAQARAYAAALASAKFHLRSATSVGPGCRTFGRPRIRNHGSLSIGADCVLLSTPVAVELHAGPFAELLIGRGTIINSGTSIAAQSRIHIGARVLVAPYVIINDSSYHQLYDRQAAPPPRPVVIEDDVWIGAKATVTPGVHIGRGAVITGHALVTRDVQPFSIVAGVPAQQVGELDEEKFVVRGAS